jgi:hypothetical protein
MELHESKAAISRSWDALERHPGDAGTNLRQSGMPGALIYLTQRPFLRQDSCSRDRVFALFLLLYVRLYATSGNGTRQCANTDAPLTTNHLRTKGDIWLRTILTAYRNPSFTICLTGLTHPSPVSIATLWRWRKPAFSIRSSCSFLAASPNRLGPMPISICSEPCGVLRNVTGNDSHKLATKNDTTAPQPPAPKGRVFLFRLASRSSPEEYGCDNPAICGGAQ